MTNSERVIYLDMDGVCADFASAGMRANGFVPQDVFAEWERAFLGKFRPYDVLGIGTDAYWQAVASQGEALWTNLEAYPWFPALYDALTEIAPVIFLSSPTRTPSSLSGKLAWLQRHFGVRFREYIFTPHKHLLANERAILIDDFETNVKRFAAAGGQAILFPQLWNSNHHIQDRLAYTLTEVQRWYEVG